MSPQHPSCSELDLWAATTPTLIWRGTEQSRVAHDSAMVSVPEMKVRSGGVWPAWWGL